MDAGRLIVIAGGTVAGVWLLSRLSASSAAAPGSNASAASSDAHGLIQPTVTDFGPVVPQLGPFYAALKPIADNITTPLVHKVNSAVGGVSPYGPLKANGDGTYTDGTGAKITPHPDGTYTRTNPSFSQTNGGKVIIATGKGIAKGAKAAYHWAEGLF